jgi:hypothetical protein
MAPSSPANEGVNPNYFPDAGGAFNPDHEAQIKFQLPTIVERMVTTLVQTSAHRNPGTLTNSLEIHLLNHLHINPVTLADVVALVPALNYKCEVMAKLAVNISYFHIYGFISPSALDQMLIHLLTKGDCYHKTFEYTKTQITRFNNEVCHRNPQLRQFQHQQRLQQKADTKKLNRKAEYRRQTIPAQLKEPKPPGMLPTGCRCIGDIITECYGMSWNEYWQLPRPSWVMDKTGTKTRKLCFSQPRPESPNEPEVGRPCESGHFSRTRLHNGPGLMDRKRPKVCLPQVDLRNIVTTVEDLIVGEEKMSDDDFLGRILWAKTKPSFDFLYEKKVGKLKRGIVFKLPPPE